MNLSIEDLEAIKAIVRGVVKEELNRYDHRHIAANPSQQQSLADATPSPPEQPQEVVARIPRM